MKDYQREFIEFAIASGVLVFGSFELKSGRKSPYFFNAGLFNSGHALARLGSFYAAALQESGLSYDVLFGPAYKGIPLVCALSIALDGQQVSAPFAFSRKEKKDHGEGGQIVGTPLKDQRIVVVDDVITAGTAIRESASLIQKESGLMSGVLIAIDRQEKGLDTPLSAIQQVERDFGIPVLSIVSLSDIISYLEELGGHEEHVKSMREYRTQWGISN